MPRLVRLPRHSCETGENGVVYYFTMRAALGLGLGLGLQELPAAANIRPLLLSITGYRW